MLVARNPCMGDGVQVVSLSCRRSFLGSYPTIKSDIKIIIIIIKIMLCQSSYCMFFAVQLSIKIIISSVNSEYFRLNRY